MMLSKHENSKFEYVMTQIFTPVINECKGNIESIIEEDRELKLEIEHEIELIMKMRAFEKALNAKLILEVEKSKEYSRMKMSDVISTRNEGANIDYLSQLKYSLLNPEAHLNELTLHFNEETLIKPDTAFNANIQLSNHSIQKVDLRGKIKNLAMAV